MASLNLGTLYVSLNADTKNFASGLTTAAEKIGAFARKAKESMAQVAGATTVLSAVGGAALALASTVDNGVAKSMNRLKAEVTLVAIQVAHLLLPAVNQLAAWFDRLAHFIAGLSPHTQKMIANFAVWVVGVGAAAKVFEKFLGLVSVATSAFSAISGAVAAVGLGPLLGIAVALVAVVGLVALLHRAWRENWAGIQNATGEVLKTVGGWFQAFFDFMKSGWGLILDVVKAFIDHLLTIGDVIEKITGKNLGMAGIHEGINGLFKDLKTGEFFTAALDFGKAVGGKIVSGVKEEWSLIFKELGIDKLISKLKGTSGPLIGGSFPIRNGVLDDLEMQSLLGRKARRVSMAPEDLVDGGHDILALGRLGAANGIYDTEGARQKAMTREFFATRSHFADAQALIDSKKLTLSVSDAIALAFAPAAGDVDRDLGQRMRVLIETIGRAIAPVLDKIGEGLKVAGGIILSKMGDAGQIISSAMQGFQQAGPLGAAMAVIAEFLVRTKSFASMLDTANGTIESIVKAFDPIVGLVTKSVKTIWYGLGGLISMLLGTLAPIFGALGQALSTLAPVLMVVTSLLTVLGPILGMASQPLKLLAVVLDLLVRGIYEFLRLVTRGVLFIVTGISGIWNGIVNALAGIVDNVVKTITFGSVKNGGDFIRQATIDMTAMNDAATMLASTNYDAAKQVAENGAANAAAAAEVTKVAEALTNVPDGFKVALARFNASDPTGDGTAPSMGGAAQHVPIQVENLYLQSDDPAELHEKIMKHARKAKFRATGRVPKG